MTHSTRRSIVAAVAVAGAVLGCGGVSSAAVLTGTYNGSPGMPANLTTLGDTDWAYWSSSTTPGTEPRLPDNKKTGVSHLIGAVSNINGSGVRGGNMGDLRFAFSDGTSPASSGSQQVGGIFNAALDTQGTGVRVAVTLPDTHAYRVSVWVSGYNSVGTLTATLPGSSSYVDSSTSYIAVKAAKLYQFDVQADHAGDALTLSYVMTTDKTGTSETSSHVLIGGIAVDAIPEPASLAILAPMALLPLRRRRVS